MSLPFKLALRNDRQMAKLVRPDGTPRPVLGTQTPEEDNRRAMITERLQIRGHAARQVDKPATIDEPLPVRSQTQLSYHLPPEIRQLVNGGVTDAISASRKTQDNIGVRVELEFD